METQAQDNKGVVIAEKQLMKKYLYGQISSGGGIISLGSGKALKIIALNEMFVTVQLLEGGIGVPIKTQGWQKVKKEIITVIKEAAPQKKLVEVVPQIEFDVNEEKKVLF